MKPIVQRYLNSWYLPVVCSIVILILLNLSIFITADLVKATSPLAYVFLGLFVLSLVGQVGAFILSAKQRQRIWIAQLSLLLLFIVGTVIYVLANIIFAAALGVDGFSRGLSIPTDIAVEEPIDDNICSIFEVVHIPELKDDGFQKKVLASLKRSGGDNATVTADVDDLQRVSKQSPELLKRYLASNPTWRLFREDGARYATKRWCTKDGWQDEGNHWDVPKPDGNGSYIYSFSMTLGFTHTPLARMQYKPTNMTSGETKCAITQPWDINMYHAENSPLDTDSYGSSCLINAAPLLIDIKEVSNAKERRMTKAAITALEDEFAPLQSHPDWATLEQLLPAGSITHGKPSLVLFNKSGSYAYLLRINPGEPGYVYLKAFEYTHNTPLSADEIKTITNQWVGWSGNPTELFYAFAVFSIEEGDYGEPYAARVEVWFVPDSGAPERKLLEKVYKVEGR